MDLDGETFLTTVYVIVDDLHQSSVRAQTRVSGGSQSRLTDRGDLCLGLAQQWRCSVPGKSERSSCVAVCPGRGSAAVRASPPLREAG